STTPAVSAGSLSLSGASNVVTGSTNNQVVTVGDVAQVTDTTAFQSSYLRLNGQTAVGMSITAQSGTNGIKLADDIRATIKTLQQQMGDNGITFTVVNDQAVFTRAAVNDVQRNLYLAILLTAMVLMLFLHSFRNTLMVLVAIPCSLVSTFFIMFLLGF